MQGQLVFPQLTATMSWLRPSEICIDVDPFLTILARGLSIRETPFGLWGEIKQPLTKITVVFPCVCLR